MTQDQWESSVLSHFTEPKKTPKGYVCHCPAHDDKNPSLLIAFTPTDKGARADIKCLAGCDWPVILSAAGMQKRDVYYSPNGHTPKFQTSKLEKKERAFVDIDFDAPTAIYSYTDENGQELYQNCRYETDKLGNRLEKKTFRQRHKVGNSWAYSLNGCRRVPYNFHNLITEPDIIFDCEGEKDAETINSMGFTGTTTLKECFGELHRFCLGKLIVICEDNDEPGRKKAKEKAEKYWQLGAERVRILKFRDKKEGYDITDFKNETPDFLEKIFDIVDDLPDYNPLQDITITFTREVTPRKPLILIDGRNALPSGNLGGVVAGIGVGKSHLSEIFISLAIHPGCEPDSRIEVNLEPGEKIALMDTEQPEDDCKEILYRIFRRTGQRKQDHDTEEFYKVSVISFITLTKDERHEKLRMIFERPEYRLAILDGILDFVDNPNDPAECAGFVLWLHMMAAKHNTGVWCVMHGNRNDTTGKGKGWIGDIFQRKATCFLMLRKHKLDPKIRVLTTDFDNVKFRHADDTDLNIAMRWSEDIQGFSCVPYPEENENKLTPSMIFAQCFQQAKLVSMRKKQLVQWYIEITGKSESQAYKEIDKATGTILKKEKLRYSLAQENEDDLL